MSDSDYDNIFKYGLGVPVAGLFLLIGILGYSEYEYGCLDCTDGDLQFAWAMVGLLVIAGYFLGLLFATREVNETVKERNIE